MAVVWSLQAARWPLAVQALLHKYPLNRSLAAPDSPSCAVSHRLEPSPPSQSALSCQLQV